jgi:hypothetical protein
VLAQQPQSAWRAAAEDETQLAARMSEALERAQRAGVVRADARPDDIPLVMCGLGAVVENGKSWERYMRLVLDAFRTCDADPLPD